MRNSIGAPGLSRWLLGIGALIVFGGCGGTVLEHNQPGSDGGASNTGGRTGSGATAPGKGGSGGVVGVGGKLGGGATVGVGGKVPPGGSVGSGGKIGAGGNMVSGCKPPFTLCSDGCFDLESSQTHCGSCNAVCSSGSSCVKGSCQMPSPATCPPGTVFCANFGECLDTKSNPFACGSCNTPCNSGTRCTNGVCDPKSCVNAKATYCPSTDRCSDLQSDQFNCGACDKACGPAESCVSGKCNPPTCDLGTTYCSSSGCTDTSVDQFNCGGCDKSCLPGSHFDGLAYTCNNGTCGCSFNANKCGKACASAFWYCPPDGFMGQPMDLCTMAARNSYEACACTSCLSQIQACFGSPSCIDSMDCTLSNPCPNCQPVFSSCSDQNGALDPIAEKLVQCMNSQCSPRPPLPL